MRLGDTIAALASPPGRSARAVIRLSGPDVQRVLARCFDRAPATRGVHLARLRLSSDRDLPVLLLRFAAPASYTGEDVVEVQIPGNPLLVQRVLERLMAIDGVRAAEPGEFSARAYLHGRLTLDQAEGLAALVAAQTEDHLRAGRELLAGRTGAAYRAWAEEITTLLALVEAGIDFTDQEDVVAITPRDLHARLAAVLASLDEHLGARAGRPVTTALPRVALVGPPNAGKSTLLNALLHRRRAVTSPLAGTTRDVLAEELDLSRDLPGGPVIVLMDLAGLDELDHPRAATRERPGPAAPGAAAIDREAQERAARAAREADLMILCDPAGRFDYGPALARLAPDTPRLDVQTKADLPHASPLERRSAEALPVCALDGWNLPELRRRIVERLGAARAASLADLLPRHRLALAAFREHLAAAMESVTIAPRPDDAAAGLSATASTPTPATTPELTAAALRAGLDAIGSLIGRISPDEVLGRVFSTFCIGK